jgi:flagellar hook-associated protein 1 FlgK
MATINSALSIISAALNADQDALNVTANNVANASSTSYTREVPNWEENQPIYLSGNSYGQGVAVDGSTSQRDRVLEQRLQQQTQLSSASSSLLSALTTMQASFTPASSTTTSGNIGLDITNFFASYTALEASPTSDSLRQGVLSSAATLAGDISGAAASLGEQKTSLDQSATTIVSQVNALTTSLAQVNKQIQSLSPNADAGTLEDERQSDLTQLSSLIGFNQITTDQNGISLTTANGQLLVSAAGAVPITSGTVNGVTHFFLGTTDITTALASGGGQIGGVLTARDQSIPTTLSALDTLANSITTAVNTNNNAGTDMDGDNGNAGDIFYAPSQVAGSALSMAVVMTDPNKIAAAGLGLGTGNDANAVAAAALGTQKIVGGETASNFYSNMVSTLGSSVSETTTQGTALSASVTQLQTQRDSISSVSLDDEAANLQQFQRAYQAASQMFSILNTVMASALNLGTQTSVS